MIIVVIVAVDHPRSGRILPIMFFWLGPRGPRRRYINGTSCPGICKLLLLINTMLHTNASPAVCNVARRPGGGSLG